MTEAARALPSMEVSERPELSLVIPLYRSRSSIDLLIDRLEALKPGCSWELILVDDGSPDGTAERARERLKGAPCGAY
jgi:dolichol-phosphate mannosyltransferase